MIVVYVQELACTGISQVALTVAFVLLKKKSNQHIVMHQKCEEPDIITLKNAKHIKCQHG